MRVAKTAQWRIITRRTSIILIFFATICGIRVLAQTSATTGPERGTLVLVGGGATGQIVAPDPINRPVMKKFGQLAGGSAARVVVIPTGGTDDVLTPGWLEKLRVRAQEVMGVDHVSVMHTRDRRQADSPEFVGPLKQATGVWIPGGHDLSLIDTYVGTRVEAEIKALLARGGVVGGTSAGAVIQSSLATLGPGLGIIVDSAETPNGKILRVDATRPCWGLLTNSTIMPHWNTRKRPDLTPALSTQPGLLGIGIDEDTAAIVQSSRLEVFGVGHVGIFDGKAHGGKSYYDLSQGESFDLRARVPLPIK